jgi:type II secretory pathway pseudopilin PulG
MGLIGGVARTAVAAGTWTAVSNRVNRRQQERWAEQDQQQMMQQQAYAQSYAPPPPPAPAAPSADDKFAQLEKLGQLKNAGILTDAEFEAQKAKILAS